MCDVLRRMLSVWLKDAQAAHHLYEENIQKRVAGPAWTDPDWAEWYANYLVQRLENEVLNSIQRRFAERNPMSERNLEESNTVSVGGYGHGV